MPGLLIRLVAIWSIGFLPVVAQERGGGLQLRILTFGAITGPEQLLLVDAEEPAKGSEVTLHLNNFTGPYPAKSRNVALIEPVADAGDKPAVPVAKLTLPESLGKRVLLVLVPQPAPKRGYLAIPIRDDRAGFAPGERRFINLTGFPIGGEFDGKRSLIKPNTVTPLKIPPPPDGRDTLEVVFSYQAEGQWQPLSSGIWPYDPEARSLVFFYWHPGEKRIRIQSIVERRPPDEGNNGAGS